MQSYNKTIQFAPLGLIKMYNSGGAIKAMEFSDNGGVCHLSIKGRGPGRFGAYSSREPNTCIVNSKEVEFEFRSKDKFLTLTIPLGRKSWVLDLHF